MQNNNEELITRNTLLDEYFNTAVPIGKTLLCAKNFNAGHMTFITQLSLFDVYQFTDVANDRLPAEQQAQRPLDLTHAKGLALYFLKALIESAMVKKRRSGEIVSDIYQETLNQIGHQVYYSIPPLVANVRTLKVHDIKPMIDGNDQVVSYKVTLAHGDVLWVIDGQHRRKGIQLVVEFLDHVTSYHKYPKNSFYPIKKNDASIEECNMWNACKEMSKFCSVALEVHIGLDVSQEQTLFVDLNNKSKKVEKSLAFKFDTSNPVNQYIVSSLIPEIMDPYGFAVGDKDEVTWEEDKPSISRQQLIAVNSILFLNKPNPNRALPTDMTDYKRETANQFWRFVMDIPNMLESKHKLKTTAAQPVVLKAIAKLYFDLFFGKKEELFTEENQNKLIEGLSEFDFSHTNPAWRYYIMDEETRDKNGLTGLEAYLPKNDEGKSIVRDLGAWDENSQTFRFARTHNDVYPLIGDIIRWKCDLPSRNK
jgi:DNA-sulfur modification-associated